jgi:hypothetical protein
MSARVFGRWLRSARRMPQGRARVTADVASPMRQLRLFSRVIVRPWWRRPSFPDSKLTARPPFSRLGHQDGAEALTCMEALTVSASPALEDAVIQGAALPVVGVDPDIARAGPSTPVVRRLGICVVPDRLTHLDARRRTFEDRGPILDTRRLRHGSAGAIGGGPPGSSDQAHSKTNRRQYDRARDTGPENRNRSSQRPVAVVAGQTAV